MKREQKFIMAVIVMAIFVVAPVETVQAQGPFRTSRVKSGDKSLAAIEKSHQLMAGRITDYQTQISGLQNRNEKILRELKYAQDSTAAVEASRLRIELAQNDSLVRIYRAKVGQLEEQSDAFLFSVAARGDEKRAELKSGDPVRVAQADMIMAYADKARTESRRLESKPETADDSDIDQSGVIPAARKLLLVNNWYTRLTVTVIDPVGRSCEYQVRANSTDEFNWGSDMIPGAYKIHVFGSKVNWFLCKTVGPMSKYENNGKKYALIATINPNN